VLSGRGIRTLAYGHHADDLAETLLMNLVQHARLESFTARLQVPGEPVSIIRPLVRLRERRIAAIHRRLNLPLLGFACPYAERNVRGRYKEGLRLLEEAVGARGLAGRVVQALERLAVRG